MSNIVEIKNLSKSYGDKMALRDVSFEVKEGVMFALLGPNGAGKTTLVKSLLGITNINSGTIRLDQKDHTDVTARKSVAYFPEKFNFYPYYTVEGAVRFFAKMRGVSSDTLKDGVENALSRLGISDLAKQKIKTLSKGQLQRVGIASLLLGDAKLFIFDEPFSGLDPIGVKDLKDLFLDLKKDGKTVFINSHILSEIEKICDEVIILNEGSCIAKGNLEKLKGEHNLEDFFYKLVKGS